MLLKTNEYEDSLDVIVFPTLILTFINEGTVFVAIKVFVKIEI